MRSRSFFVWKETFALGIPPVDDQHRGFFDILNDLYDRVTARASPSALVDTHNELKFYAAKHFADEEQYLETVGYPGVVEQRLEHARFAQYLESADLARPDARATLSYLKHWMVQHILGTDRHYKDWLAAQRSEADTPRRGRAARV